MWRSRVLIGVMLMTSTFALAQGGHRNPPKRPNPLSGMSGPTTVTGEGTTTPSGLRYWDLKSGTGPSAVKGKAVKVHYTGWLGSGRKFESSLETGQPIIFLLGAEQVMKGWDEGVEGMKLGGKRQLRIPPYLGYGARGSELVPPNSALIFDIEVVGVQ